MSAAGTQWEPELPRQRSGIASVTELRTRPRATPLRSPKTQIAASSPQLSLAIGTGHSLRVARCRPTPDVESRVALERFVPRFCAVVVEVIGGDRGVQQLLRWTTEEVYSELTRRSGALSGAVGGDQRLRRLRATVRSVHIFWPSARAAEVSVHVRHGERSRALAARMELIDGRWLCSVLQFG